ncbi:DUF3800 domain-containing protein [Microbacterium sp. CJ88]|uniref:DUF3800 domain-containing protein n=1 Tax=Microbacterium sp. CJ88 TaxID=3445672 RepID=UPI003F6601A6
MLIFYTDETGDAGFDLDEHIVTPNLKVGQSHYFSLSGVGIRDSSRRPLAEALLILKRKHFGDTVDGVWGDTEIKGKFITRSMPDTTANLREQRPSGWAAIDSVQKVDALSRDIGLLLDKFRPLIFVISFDKREAIRRNKMVNPVGVAYTYLHQRIALTMEDIHAGEGAIVVADQQSHHERLYRDGVVHEMRDLLGQNLRRKPNYNLVLDKPLWVDTALSTWDREIIQLADIASYTVTIALERGAPPTELGYLWDALRPHFAVHSATGSIVDWGVSAYPRGAKVPDL